MSWKIAEKSVMVIGIVDTNKTHIVNLKSRLYKGNGMKWVLTNNFMIRKTTSFSENFSLIQVFHWGKVACIITALAPSWEHISVPPHAHTLIALNKVAFNEFQWRLARKNQSLFLSRTKVMSNTPSLITNTRPRSHTHTFTHTHTHRCYVKREYTTKVGVALTLTFKCQILCLLLFPSHTNAHIHLAIQQSG